MSKSRQLYNLSQRYVPLKRNVMLASLIFFLLSVVVYAFHHHDQSFSLASCSICKVKISLSGSFSKNKIDAVQM